MRRSLFLILVLLSCNKQVPKDFPTHPDHYRPIYNLFGDSVGVRMVKDDNYSIHIGQHRFWTSLRKKELASIEENRVFLIDKSVYNKPYSHSDYLEIKTLSGQPVFESSYLSPIFKSLAPGSQMAIAPNAHILYWGIQEGRDQSYESVKILDKNGKEIFSHQQPSRPESYYWPKVALNERGEYLVCHSNHMAPSKRQWILRKFDRDGNLVLTKQMEKTTIRDVGLSTDGKIAFLSDEDRKNTSQQVLHLLDANGLEIQRDTFDFVASDLRFKSNKLIRLYRDYFGEKGKGMEIEIQ